ncbi:LppC putative lipoprotein [Methylophaga lonarensis MPL]|uniref:LppC putative lipoprotein n=1 Tax=Methylophaga lonarensis MPL TaxID=1286106 RepID=M7P1H3_9GAMM|nr:penicillin-binding protein activator [Methylophaga lonarensis]EMR13331.1 LppC putative lipoprotein [Methylophaga lonarensis MPL]
MFIRLSQTMFRLTSKLLLIVSMLTLMACQPMQPLLTQPAAPVETEISDYERQGLHAEAAAEYLSMAEDASGALQSQYYLRAAVNLQRIGESDSSQQALDEVKLNQLSNAQQREAQILRAQLALDTDTPSDAIAFLSDFDLRAASVTQQRQVLKIRAQAYGTTENWLEQALSYIRLDEVLPQEQRPENHQNIWKALMELSPQALDLFNPGVPPAVDSGWFALAFAIRAYQANPEAMEVAIEDWKRAYPNHPATPELYEQAIAAGTYLPDQIMDIAVLLPQSGPVAAAAEAVKQGIIAAHFAAGGRGQLHFLDVHTDNRTGQSNVIQRYREAVGRNASVVIGPLDRQSVEILAESGDLPVPVIALNRLGHNQRVENLFQFGLAPEDEAVAVAQRARAQNYQRAMILSPDSEWGQRVAQAFTQAWQQQGGVVITNTRYLESEHDFADTIVPMFGLNASRQRAQDLRRTLGVSVEFEPRRRQDVDFLFMVARANKAGQLLPQLQFHRSGTLPVYSTSHAYTGDNRPQRDIDLNGLQIPDVRWAIPQLAESDPAYQAVKQQAGSNFGDVVRLAAMGADAYRLIPELNSMSRSPDLTFSGASGDLTINSSGQIIRKSPWATFRDGTIEAISSE